MIKISKKLWVTFIFTVVISGVAVENCFREKLEPTMHPVAMTEQHGKWENPFLKSSPAYFEAEHFFVWLMAHKKLDDAVGAGSQLDRFNYVSALGPRGMARLPDELIEKFVPLMGKMLYSLSDDECANLLRGKVAFNDLQAHELPVLGSFNATEARSWFLVTRSAIDAQLNNLPVIPLPKQTARAGVFKIAGSLPPVDGKLFLSHLANLQQENDENVCSAVRTLFAGTPLLPEPYRAAVARMLVAGKF
ncbi:hypothetical protein bAD24_III02610 [Burkholderia sp. AD24]|nr:hypothetical protein bAD24_III02610 [Burkholderia sp. AD24]